MYFLRLLLFLLCTLFFTDLAGQGWNTLRADRAFDQFQFQRAIELYESVIEQDSANLHAMKRLGDSYRLTNELTQAYEWYRKVVEFEDIDAIYYLHFAESLRAKQRYEEAEAYYLKYLMDYPLDMRARELYHGLSEMFALLEDSTHFEIENMELNTDAAEFSPAFYKNEGIVFPSSRIPKQPIRRADTWFDRPFLDLYVVYKIDEDIFSNPQPLKGKVNQHLHEGPLTFNADFTEMYFTRNYYDERKTAYGRDGILKLEIFHAKLEEEEWVVKGPVSFKSEEFSNAHPSLTEDGKTMYFSSDRSGGFGGGDIYVVHQNEDGEWGEPENLGSDINTEGEELFPYAHPDGSLYFASDGRVGLGGLDIYRAVPNENGDWDVQNLGPPINSSYDDFGLIMHENNQMGFFSSNRPGGKGSDDIYRFRRFTEHYLRVIVLDSMEQTPIENATVVLTDRRTGEAEIYKSNEEGEVLVSIQANPRYQLQVELSEKYKRRNVQYQTTHLDTSTTFEEVFAFYFEPEEVIAPPPTFVTGQIIELEDLYYDFDRYHIREDAAEVLNDLLLILETYPQLEIKLLSHTDSRGSDAYNLRLSTRRAESAMRYLLSAGIDPSRLSYEGFGKRRPVNHCVDGVECTEEEHQLNRRTEIEIIRGLETE